MNLRRRRRRRHEVVEFLRLPLVERRAKNNRSLWPPLFVSTLLNCVPASRPTSKQASKQSRHSVAQVSDESHGKLWRATRILFSGVGSAVAVAVAAEIGEPLTSFRFHRRARAC